MRASGDGGSGLGGEQSASRHAHEEVVLALDEREFVFRQIVGGDKLAKIEGELSQLPRRAGALMDGADRVGVFAYAGGLARQSRVWSAKWLIMNRTMS